MYTIIDQKRTADFINTFIRIYEQGGRLPVWELWGEETDTMIGYHAVSVIADPQQGVLDRLAADVVAGRLRVPVTRTYALDDVPEALEDFRKGTVGKFAVAVG